MGRAAAKRAGLVCDPHGQPGLVGRDAKATPEPGSVSWRGAIRSGAEDHGATISDYLSDPDGNGIDLYQECIPKPYDR